MRFVLASASPARLATLRAAGVEPEVIVSDVDESLITADSTSELVQRLANAKAAAVARTIIGPALILGCDSMLEIDGEALGKPAATEDAVARWKLMRGRSGLLRTGHCLIDPVADQARLALVTTTVHFADVTDDEIAQYVATGEPVDVAGAFTIDGLGGWYITGIEGDHHNVVGLSLPTLREMLAALKYSLADIGWPTR